MFETLVYADMGSAYTKLFARGSCSIDESRIALDPDNDSCVLAVGSKCRSLLNAVPVFPVRGGAVANSMLASIMLRRMTLELLKRKTLLGVSVRLLLPDSMGVMQKQAACAAAKEAGFLRVSIEDTLLAGARGAGLDIDRAEAVMTADLGRDKLAAAVQANGGTVSQSFHRIGSRDFERTLQAYFAEEHGMLIGSLTAETLKKSLHVPNVPVCGRSAATGEPKVMLVRSSELRAALSRVYTAIADELTEALNAAPPEAAADICERGVLLIGGGARQYTLCEELGQRLRLSVSAADNADTAAVYGASEARKHIERLRGVKPVKGFAV